MPPDLTPEGKLDRDAAAAELRRYLDTVLPAARLDVRFRIVAQDQPAGEELDTAEIVIDFEGRDQELLLERGAELLKALEYIGVRWLRLDSKLHDRVRFDCCGYRADRLAELKLSAQVAADKVRQSRQAFRFNPMSAQERRIVHLVLKDQPGIRTASEGVGEARQVVIFPDESK
jgi:spoIIIJ-associated protein